MNRAHTRAAILASAETWLDTPYRHQSSVKHVGTDCLGLIRGIWRDVYGAEPETPPAYTPDWAENSGEETLYDAAARWLTPVSAPYPGDAILFRMAAQAPCKHIGILWDADHILHAYWGKSVVKSYFAPFWQRRHVASFAFPSLL
ncbi:MAG: NlpC/P60 family protein [Litorimonas sp.]